MSQKEWNKERGLKMLQMANQKKKKKTIPIAQYIRIYLSKNERIKKAHLHEIIYEEVEHERNKWETMEWQIIQEENPYQRDANINAHPHMQEDDWRLRDIL